MVSFDGENGQWAKATNEFLFRRLLDIRNLSSSLNKVTAPEFNPITLEMPSAIKFSPDEFIYTFIWSEDSRSIIFSCRIEDSIAIQLCIVDADGKNARVLSPDIFGMHFLSLRWWLDPQTLVLTDYNGGGHISVLSVDIETGKLEPWGASFEGEIYPPHNNIVPATNDTGQYDYKLLAISGKYPPKILAEPSEGGNILRLPEYRSIPRAQTINIFDDWLPNSNQMLVFWGYFNPGDRKPRGYDLILWDLDKNKVRLIAPNGRGGKFSPDGKLLAYLTSGPAKLDSNSRPTAERIIPAEPGKAEPEKGFMQLLDMSSGKVEMSIPIIATMDYDEVMFQAHGFPNAQFSPDNRYLALLTPGKVVENPGGWPIDVDNDPSSVFINILDLHDKKIVWSAAS